MSTKRQDSVLVNDIEPVLREAGARRIERQRRKLASGIELRDTWRRKDGVRLIIVSKQRTGEIVHVFKTIPPDTGDFAEYMQNILG